MRAASLHRIAPLALALVAAVHCGGTRVPEHAARVPRPAATPTKTPVATDPDTETEEPRPVDEADELADETVDRATRAVVDAPRESLTRAPAVAWDKRTDPASLARVVEHYGLTAAERKTLVRNGFVVPARLSYKSFGVALHDVHQRELPLYVSADAVLHAVFMSHEAMVAEAENKATAMLRAIVDKMEAELPRARASYDTDVAHDAAVYLEVARRLLAGEGNEDFTPPAPPPPDPEVDALVAAAVSAKGLGAVTLFGRRRVVDWSFYLPRGPYDRSSEGRAYFRAMVWLTRLEMNLASRDMQSSSPFATTAETPREATLAMTLADLAGRANVLPDVEHLERFGVALVGAREDVPLSALRKLGAGVDLTRPDAAAAALRGAIGPGYARTVNYHVMPAPAARLPAIATFLGVGFTPDTAPLAALSPKGAPRVVNGPDVAFLLGQDRARAHFNAFPGAPPPMDVLVRGRSALATAPVPTSLYGAWLGAVRGLAWSGPPPGPTLPAFMATPAFADARVASTVAGYGQLRHANVLYAVQAYEEGGCTIPDAWVEPALDVYDGLLTYANVVAHAPEPLGGDEARAWASRLALVVGALKRISEAELAGAALTPEQIRFLGMVAEYDPASRGYMPKEHHRARYNGWYPRMFYGREQAFTDAAFVADYFTSPTFGKVAYLGANDPAMGIFVVDAGGAPRVMVGPVARAFALVAPMTERVADGGDTRGRRAPWEDSYVVRAPSTEFWAMANGDVVQVHAEAALGPFTVERTDPHGNTLDSARGVHTADEKVSVALPHRADGSAMDGLRIRLADGRAFTRLHSEYLDARYSNR